MCIVVSPDDENSTLHRKNCYKVAVCCREGVRPFGPRIPRDAYFDESNLQSFLLTKLINAERAAMEAPAFKERLGRARTQLLYDICVNK